MPVEYLKTICASCLQGTEIWSSPQQPVPLKNLVTYPQLKLVVTIDTKGLIKMWKAETGWELASFCLPTSSSAMEPCDHPEGLFLLVSELALRTLCRDWPPPGPGHTCDHHAGWRLEPGPSMACRLLILSLVSACGSSLSLCSFSSCYTGRSSPVPLFCSFLGFLHIVPLSLSLFACSFSALLHSCSSVLFYFYLHIFFLCNTGNETQSLHTDLHP